ncbi:nickel-dependent hydrogenase large subunit [Ruminiclostridium cellulolyticum]|uniref:NADH-ubiquinone oxidoreductase chain 49kDa n=1 Tax=Ruminiclostridium cellulolyticum (strain ATCC 35319 / DSM 5812 / JCM 6584 / H10) TaxID=394503 RepID=B8I1M1_RUMCH|nr:nickel-dependent hydrogenase large subunit [Ruminiclostridium cellulolyticum]ACL77656.1 NADH-ubiquinone oxidoreductase chain 49kDa [Ruminiclostridium cellulolyticum H10]
MSSTVIPFGPQHPVLPEPLHIKLVMEDENIVEAIPAIGYVHRGLEKLTETKEFTQNTYVVERVCGICSVMHAMAYCQGIEELMNIEISDRAKFLRVIWAELHRMHSHFLWLGLVADAFGFESLFMQTWRDREKVMDIMEETAGSRVVISCNTIGGTRRDLTKEQMAKIVSTVDEIKHDLEQLEAVFLNNYTVKHRLVGVGVLTKADAIEYSTVGPMARASGIATDLRTTGYSAYGQLDFEPITHNDGDCYARTYVRLKEVYQSIDLIKQAIAKIPEGEHVVPFKGFPPKGDVISRVEQPRGEVLYYLRGNGTKNLDRLRLRTPTFANIPSLLKMLPGSQLADVPMLILTIDPCISCTER